jgi:hypothetical protein
LNSDYKIDNIKTYCINESYCKIDKEKNEGRSQLKRKIRSHLFTIQDVTPIIGQDIAVPDHPDTIGALGAALMARERSINKGE